MKNFAIWLIFLSICTALFGQSSGVRWDLGTPGSAGVVSAQGTTGNLRLFAVPNVTLNFCTYPANAVPCTNLVTTYTSLAASTACPTNAQVVLQGSSTCQATGDATGNLGVYLAQSGTYAYTLTIHGVSYGPYTVTIGGNSSGGGTSNFSALIPGTNISTTPFSIAPASVVGGSTSNFSVTGPASDTNTAPVGNFDTGTASLQPSFRAGVQGFDAIKAYAIGSNEQQTQLGYCSTPPASGSDYARHIACASSGGPSVYRFLALAAGFNQTVVQAEMVRAQNATPKLFGGRVGVNADGTIGAGAEVFAVNGNGQINGLGGLNLGTFAGTSPPTNPCGTAVNCVAWAEGSTSGLSPQAGYDVEAYDSTQHGVVISLNGGAAFYSLKNFAANYQSIIGLWSGCSGIQYLGFDGNCHTASGGLSGLTSGIFPQATGASSVANSSPQLDNGVTLANSLSYAGTAGINSTNGPVSAGSRTTTGTMCPSGVTGAWCAAEGSTAGTPTAAGDYIRADSTAHRLLASENGGAETGLCIPGTFAAQTDAATVTWAIANAKCANASLTFTVHSGSRTLNLTNPVNGGSYVIWLKQDTTGGEGLTLGTGCTWKVSGGGAGAVTLSTGANAIDVLAFTYDGTNCYANLNKNFN